MPRNTYLHHRVLHSAHDMPDPGLSHISIGVRNYDVSKAFYTAVLETIGLRLVYDSETKPTHGEAEAENEAKSEDDNNKGRKRTRTLGFGPDEAHETLNIFEFPDESAPLAPGPGFHLAFNAPTRDAVIEFHARAVGFGGSDNGLPGLRKQYGETYFAAFVVDPDGWRLEAVCKNET
ncbi:Lactoylglutathione lyase [Diplogelasinospora grovesii]|uniref:Lactoylglutathione lyase n=1 Tax=Diplogelasinospora grovesii TaxID=303347 RepID=A0AAN6N946_9PEZI|nr:Lactoylglutathione lyase [Diplogelasinospora grovesii]